MTAQSYEDGDTVSYLYDNSGGLASVADSATGITTTYYYDLSERLMKYTEESNSLTHSVKYVYDDNNNLYTHIENIDGVSRTTNYRYTSDNQLRFASNGWSERVITYDNYHRLSQRITRTHGTVLLTNTYNYFSPTNTTSAGQIASHQMSGLDMEVTYSYTYDDNGNILTISDGSNTTSYVYDSQNQLLRENNQAGGFTHVWTYDNAGNILSRTEYPYTTGSLENVTSTDTVSYTYDDAAWGDLLIGYDGNEVSCDEIGNMLSDGTRNFTWEHGRQLASLTEGSTTWNYTYNSAGLRTGRTDGTTSYTYVYDGSRLMVAQKDNVLMRMSYDATGPLSLIYNGATYRYEINIQGDVIALLDTEGDVVVEYIYDAWGNPLTITGELADTVGVNNPLRYRGYVYDQDTGLYYLQSRYYDPEIGRFINADAFASTGQGLLGNNMFAYCGNNPVNYCDPTGHRFGPTSSQIMTCCFGAPGLRGTELAQLQREAGMYPEDPVVLDISYSVQIPQTPFYGKIGGSTVIDFTNTEANFYIHGGGGLGYSDGLSFAIGLVENYNEPIDYSEWFVDLNVGYYLGVDHCWDPRVTHEKATQATAVTFGSGANVGVGIDWYFTPIKIWD